MKIFKKIFVGFIGAGIVAALKICLTVFSFLCKVIAYFLVYFGLEFLFMYLFACAFLFMTNNIIPDINTLNFKLFLFGIALALACSILISIKNLLYNPISIYFRLKFSISKKLKKEKFKNNIEEKTADNINIKDNGIIHSYPMVYRSVNNKDIVVFEYKDFYHIYKSNEFGQLVKIDEKPKFIEHYKNEVFNQNATKEYV